MNTSKINVIELDPGDDVIIKTRDRSIDGRLYERGVQVRLSRVEDNLELPGFRVPRLQVQFANPYRELQQTGDKHGNLWGELINPAHSPGIFETGHLEETTTEPTPID